MGVGGERVPKSWGKMRQMGGGRGKATIERGTPLFAWKSDPVACKLGLVVVLFALGLLNKCAKAASPLPRARSALGAPPKASPLRGVMRLLRHVEQTCGQQEHRRAEFGGQVHRFPEQRGEFPA